MADLRIAGYASVFNIADKGGDIVRKGAFAGAAVPVPLLWQHEAREPIGFVERLQEDDRGLRIVARLVAAGRGGDAAALVRARAVDGLSFGYRVKAGRPGRGGRELAALELIEVSLVTFPMQPLARILGFSTVAEETMDDL
jgi:uncharacterized protein